MSTPEILVTDQPVPADELARLVRAHFGTMVKLVVDVERRLVGVGGELHADAEALLLADGSRQQDVWGANYYPGRGPDHCLEYTALINIRPASANPGMVIADPALRDRVRDIVTALIGAGEPLQ